MLSEPFEVLFFYPVIMSFLLLFLKVFNFYLKIFGVHGVFALQPASLVKLSLRIKQEVVILVSALGKFFKHAT